MTTSPDTQKRWTLAVLLMAPFMAQADATIANVSTPSIHADLGASGADLELVIGGYLIAFAALLITGARLGQTHGYRRIFLFGVTTFTVASLLCGLAPVPLVLIGARVLQGAGAALMFPQTLTGIRLGFRGSERARAIALYAVALSVGAAAGQLLGGALISANIAGLQWRSIFFVNVPVGIAVVAAGIRYLPADGARASRGVDLVGVAMLTATVLLIVIPLALGRADGWPTWSWLMLAASVPMLSAFLAAQRRVAARGASPLVNLHALAPPAVCWGLGAIAIATGTYYGLLFTTAQYIQQGLGKSALLSGATLVAFVLAFGVAGQVVRRLSAPMRELAAPAGCLLLATAYGAISVALLDGLRSETELMMLLGAAGFGLGIQYNALIAHLTDSVQSQYAPDISGVTTTTMQVAGAIAVAAFGTAYLGIAPHAGASQAFAIVTGSFAAMAFAAALSAHRATVSFSARRSAA